MNLDDANIVTQRQLNHWTCHLAIREIAIK